MSLDSLLNITLAFVCIISGIALIYFYEVKIKNKGGLDYKLRTAGIGLIIIGIGLILREFDVCC